MMGNPKRQDICVKHDHCKIKKVATGEVKEVTFDFEYNPYIWEEGNFSCDCNRAIFFGEPESEQYCSDDRYIIVSIIENGIVVFPKGESNGYVERQC
jgi:hypothetical protein